MGFIVIADSHALCREALCQYIRHAEPDMIIEEAGDYEELKKLINADDTPDLILFDKNLDGYDDHAFSKNMSSLSSRPKIGMMISLFDEAEGHDLSVQGVFSKTLSSKAILSGIQDVLSGRTFFPALEDNIRFENYGVSVPPVHKDFDLTMREKEVLAHLVKGASNKEIARELDLQVVTIKLHVRGICRKMKAANRTQAALIAKENGWG